MSKQFLTIVQAYTKLGLSGGGAGWITKAQLVATGKCDTAKLENYKDNQWVVDDDIVKKADPLDSAKKQVGSITLAIGDTDNVGFYTGKYGKYTMQSNDTGTSSIQAIRTWPPYGGISFNMHLSRVSGTYNRIVFRMVGNGIDKTYGPFTVAGNDWEWYTSSDMALLFYNNVGKTFTITVYLYKE